MSILLRQALNGTKQPIPHYKRHFMLPGDDKLHAAVTEHISIEKNHLYKFVTKKTITMSRIPHKAYLVIIISISSTAH